MMFNSWTSVSMEMQGTLCVNNILILFTIVNREIYLIEGCTLMEHKVILILTKFWSGLLLALIGLKVYHESSRESCTIGKGIVEYHPHLQRSASWGLLIHHSKGKRLSKRQQSIQL